ncbi:MAG: bZIP transcription factor [Candidatus Eremiobacteraeota bacterium]|nr:bZIP transcription factor [Candidatus Eremiobacteraeota bacterium]
MHFHAPERHTVLSRVQIARIAFVFVIGFFALARTLPDSLRIVWPIYVFGYYTDTTGTITTIFPDSPAEKAGLRLGDRVLVKDFAQADRKGGLIGRTYSAYNPIRHMSIVRDRVRMSVEIKGVAESLATRGVILLREIVALITIAIGMLLAIVRPNRATLGFFHFVVGGDVYPNALTNIWLDYPWRMIVDMVNDVLVAGAGIGLFMFALGFPRDIPTRWRIPADGIAGIVWLISSVLFLWSDIGPTYGAWTNANPAAHAYAVLQTTIAVLAILVFVITLFRTRGADQVRVAWVVVAFMIAVLGELVAERFYPGTLKYYQYVALLALPILPAFAVSYGVTRYHILGIDFFVNRAIVYAAMTTAIVCVIGLMEEGFSYWFVMNTNLAYAIIIAITLVFGTFFGKIRDGIRFVVDRLMFRDRLDAHDRLDAIARELPHAIDRERIEYALTSEVQQALDLRCAALFELRGDRYVIVADAHWPPSAAWVPSDDPTLQRVARLGIAEFLRERDWIGWSPDLRAVTPRVAVPIEVDAGAPFIAVYGVEQSGVDIDVDEVRALERLATGAAVGFSSLRTRELAEHLEELMVLREENARLRARLAELSAEGEGVRPLTETPRPRFVE